jgi:hypothetical protein
MQQYSQFNMYSTTYVSSVAQDSVQLLILIFCDTLSKVQNVNLQTLDKIVLQTDCIAL